MGERIRKVRLFRGWTQDELGEAVGIDRASISRYESGKRDPYATHLAKICVALKISADEVLFGTRRASGRKKDRI